MTCPFPAFTDRYASATRRRGHRRRLARRERHVRRVPVPRVAFACPLADVLMRSTAEACGPGRWAW